MRAHSLLTSLLRGLGYDNPLYSKIIIKLCEKPMTSTEIYKGVAKRTTVIYHLNKLVEGGLLVKKGNLYFIRGGTLEAMVKEIKRDVDRLFEELVEVARQLDRELGNP